MEFNFEQVCEYAVKRIAPDNVHQFLEDALAAKNDQKGLGYFDDFAEDHEDFFEWIKQQTSR